MGIDELIRGCKKNRLYRFLHPLSEREIKKKLYPIMCEVRKEDLAFVKNSHYLLPKEVKRVLVEIGVCEQDDFKKETPTK